MNHQEDIEKYILNHIEDEPQVLKELDHHTHVMTINPRMLSGHLEGRILKMLTKMINATRVIELGTFTGYSAICFAEAVCDKDNAEVITIDNDDEMGEIASEYIEKSGFGNIIKQVTGDAMETLKNMTGHAPFDIAFVDADKREYSQYLELLLPLMRNGGIIIADNTLWDGHVVEHAKSGDHQTIALQRFNNEIKCDNRIESVILPIRDGMTIIRKKD